ncbi:DUF4249 domain-containing protein [Paraflavisolibacter sp. H34]|uniref:DUF4249 domain-containing protein n=1 Tax=Huijunlia imazamoxiresistens TaxID=3127457 RepID=UPI00301794C1
MKQTAFWLYTLLLAVIITSCEKVIDVKVNEADKKYVVEGQLTDSAGSCQVRITQTKNIDENNTFGGVSGAQVVITDETGAVHTLAESSPGVYVSPLKGVPGRLYSLRAAVGGQVFTSAVRMPQPLGLDSLYVSKITVFGEENRIPNLIYKDSTGKGNAYRFIPYVNGKKDKGIFIENDDFSDGRRNTTTLYIDGDELEKGDTLTVEMQCIDPVLYKYWQTLAQGSTGQSQTASPANPITNISGGALGYFSVHTVRRHSLVVQ